MDLQLINWELVSTLVIENSIEAASKILKWEIIGIVISIALIIIYWKRGILKRPAHKYYNWSVKLYIPLLLIIGFIFFGKAGVIRFAHEFLTRQNQDAVNALYDKSFGQVLGHADDPKSLIRYAEKIGQTVKTVDEGMNNLATHVMLNSSLDSNYVENSMTALMVQHFWKTKGRELIIAGSYYLFMMVLEKAHIPGEPEKNLTIEEFKYGIEKLKDLDAHKLEAGIKDKIGGKTQSYIDSKMHTMFYLNLLFWLLLALVPLIEYLLYKKIFEKKLMASEKLPAANQ
jgi:hypothetical protein